MPNLSKAAFSLMQVFCQSSEENDSFPEVITTDNGLIAFTKLDFQNENQILMFISMKSIATTQESAILWA